MALFSYVRRKETAKKVVILISFVAFATYISSLYIQAGQLRGPTDVGIIKQGSIGPLSLFELQKIPAGDLGYKISIQFLSGSVTYLIIWTLVAVCFITISQSKKRR